jgi:hypothetical protein
MAKKRTTSRTKSRAAGRKAATTAATPYRVSLQSVLQFVEMLKHQGQLDEFMNEAERSGTALTMDANAVAFVTEYLDRRELHTVALEEMGARDVNPCPCIRR